MRVEVSDQGGPWERSATDDDQNGRGLLVVAQLARNFGRIGDDQSGMDGLVRVRVTTGQDSAARSPSRTAPVRPSRRRSFSTASDCASYAASAACHRKNWPTKPG